MNNQQQTNLSHSDQMHEVFSHSMGRLNAISRVVLKGLDYSTIYGVLPITEVAKLRLVPKEQADSSVNKNPYPRLTLLEVIATYQQLLNGHQAMAAGTDNLIDQLSALVEIYQINAAFLAAAGEKIPHVIFNGKEVLSTGVDQTGAFQPLTAGATFKFDATIQGRLKKEAADKAAEASWPFPTQATVEELTKREDFRAAINRNIEGLISVAAEANGEDQPSATGPVSIEQHVSNCMKPYQEDINAKSPKGKAVVLVCAFWLAGREARMDTLFAFEDMINLSLRKRSYPSFSRLGIAMEAIIRSPEVLPTLSQEGMVQMLEGLSLLMTQKEEHFDTLVGKFGEMGYKAINIPSFPAVELVDRVIPKRYRPDVLNDVLESADMHGHSEPGKVTVARLITAVANLSPRLAGSEIVSLQEVKEMFNAFGNYQLPKPIHTREDLLLIFSKMSKEKLELMVKGLDLQVLWGTPSPDGQKGISWTTFIRHPAEAVLEAVQAAVGDDLRLQGMMRRAIRRYL